MAFIQIIEFPTDRIDEFDALLDTSLAQSKDWRTGTPLYARSMGAGDIEGRVRAICLALPGVTEKVSHGSPAFFATRQFVMLWPDGHHDHHFPHLWCAAPPGAQEGLVDSEPRRFFRPPYVGSRGWVGVRLDGRVDWAALEALCEDAYRCVAPRKLITLLDVDQP